MLNQLWRQMKSRPRLKSLTWRRQLTVWWSKNNHLMPVWVAWISKMVSTWSFCAPTCLVTTYWSSKISRKSNNRLYSSTKSMALISANKTSCYRIKTLLTWIMLQVTARLFSCTIRTILSATFSPVLIIDARSHKPRQLISKTKVEKGSSSRRCACSTTARQFQSWQVLVWEDQWVSGGS